VNPTDSGLALGTPSFMSPEQTLAETVDHRCDIWALGVVLYYMLSGRLPFVGESPAALYRAIREREPAPLEAPPPLPAILARALAKRVGDRYASMRAFVADLHATRLAGPIAYELSGTKTEPWTPSKRIVRSTTPIRAAPRAIGNSRFSCELVDISVLAERLIRRCATSR
jgi:serine/threonine-protein kinase